MYVGIRVRFGGSMLQVQLIGFIKTMLIDN